MTLEDEFDAAMENVYRRAGRKAGYWANYFNRDLKKHGGLATAKHLLQPKSGDTVHTGFQALIDAGMPHISVEYVALTERFRGLFSEDELAEAQRRLAAIPAHAIRQPVSPADNHPETLSARREYFAGAVRQVLVNQYERDPVARAACLRHLGSRCKVCDLCFEEKYGEIGKDFIHVHHKKPLAACREIYQIDPVRDLVPVCPNCHAMLHTSDPPMTVEELQNQLASCSVAR